MPKVQITKLLRDALTDDGLDPDGFADYFAEWKAEGAAGLFIDFYFGKDSFYDRPRRNGRRVLRHVHLPPEQDQKALGEWELNWKRQRSKTSDTALIYAEDPGQGCLLIALVREPNGHQIARMATPQSRQFMNDMADVADTFIHTGTFSI